VSISAEAHIPLTMVITAESMCRIASISIPDRQVLSSVSTVQLGQLARLFVHATFREAERKRIERTNPNPKMPLVRFVGDTWRTGGVLALSRAFGDAYLKVTHAASIRRLP
jgi:Protein phosphatase 2C